MPRWRETGQIIRLDRYDEVFDDNWMNYDRVWKYAPPSPDWTAARPMRIEDVDIWEIITEVSGPVGVYAAWCPYGELYMVTNRGALVREFSGWRANERLERYLVANGIPYPRSSEPPVDREYASKLIVKLGR